MFGLSAVPVANAAALVIITTVVRSAAEHLSRQRCLIASPFIRGSQRCARSPIHWGSSSRPRRDLRRERTIERPDLFENLQRRVTPCVEPPWPRWLPRRSPSCSPSPPAPKRKHHR